MSAWTLINFTFGRWRESRSFNDYNRPWIVAFYAQVFGRFDEKFTSFVAKCRIHWYVYYFFGERLIVVIERYFPFECSRTTGWVLGQWHNFLKISMFPKFDARRTYLSTNESGITMSPGSIFSCKEPQALDTSTWVQPASFNAQMLAR